LAKFAPNVRQSRGGDVHEDIPASACGLNETIAGGATSSRCNRFERLQPLAAHGKLEISEAGDIASWSGQVWNESIAHRIGYLHEHHRYGVGVLFNPRTAPYAKSFMQSMETAAQTLSIEQLTMPFQDVAAVEDVIDALAREPNSGLIVLPDASTVNYRDAIIGGAARHRLPDIYPYRSFAVSGGLISYGSVPPDAYRQAASSIDQILRGAKPADLPVQAPTKFELVINLKTAKALGLTVPQSLLATADEVIE
jgi:hypothetical protein